MAGSIQFEALGCTGLLDRVRAQGQGQGVRAAICFSRQGTNALACTVSHCVDSPRKAVIAVAVCDGCVRGGFHERDLAVLRFIGFIGNICPLGGSQAVSGFQPTDSSVQLITIRSLCLPNVVLLACQDFQGI